MHLYHKFVIGFIACTALYASGWFGGGYSGRSNSYYGSAGGTPTPSPTPTPTPPPFAPTDVTGLKLWVKADAIVGKNDGDTVSNWTDSSGNGYNLATAGATPPIYKTNIVNGKPVVRFDGVATTWLKGTALSNLGSVSTLSFWVVFKATSIALNNSNGWQNDTVWSEDSYASIGMFLRSSPAALFYAYDNSDKFVSQTISTGTFYVFHGRHDTGKIYSSLNNGSENNLTDGDSYASAFNGGPVFQIGAQGVNRPFTGDIAEILFYSTAVGSTDRTAIQGYLNTKYAIY